MKKVFLVLIFATLVSLTLRGATLLPSVVQAAQQISAKALTDHECDATEWHFVITQVDVESNAPASITVTWQNGASETVSLNKYTGKTAHYVTTSNLDSVVISVTTSIYDGWDGQFNLSHGPCSQLEVSPSPSPSVSPSPSPTPDPTPILIAEVSPSPVATPSPTPMATPEVSPSPTSSPTSDSGTGGSTSNAAPVSDGIGGGGQVLGATKLAATGSAETTFALTSIMAGLVLTTTSAYGYRQSKKSI